MERISSRCNTSNLGILEREATQSQDERKKVMKVLVSVFLAIALLFGPAACTDVETREQKFANTEKKAAGGNVPALYTLGLMYEQGYGVSPG